jgi:hypothetical protein
VYREPELVEVEGERRGEGGGLVTPDLKAVLHVTRYKPCCLRQHAWQQLVIMLKENEKAHRWANRWWGVRGMS